MRLLPLLLLLVQATGLPLHAAPEPYQALMKSGEWRAAYDLLRPRLLDRATSDRVARELNDAVTCLQQLNRVEEAEALIEGVVAVHQDRWRMLQAAAEAYQQLPHYGYLIAGEFRRGDHRGGGKIMNARERDRVRRLQLLQLASKIAEAETKPVRKPSLGKLYEQIADALYQGRSASTLLRKTDLTKLPDYDTGWDHYGGGGGGGGGAPVDADGDPVFVDQPDSWEAANNDGERWRWALARMVAADEGKNFDADITWADFVRDQFGVQTLARHGRWGLSHNASEGQSSTFDLHTLAEDETIARLATGVRRITLPDTHNHLKLYRKAYGRAKANQNRHQIERVLSQVATVFENRRQYGKAAKYWRLVEAEGLINGQRTAKRQLAQIEQPLGRFEGQTPPQPAGRGAEVAFRFRNATSVELTAQRIDVDKMLDDLQRRLESRPKKLKPATLQIEQLGNLLLKKEGERYLSEQLATWTTKLKPADNHFDRRATLSTPLQEAGAYLLTARLKGADGQAGNVCKIVLRIADTAIVRKPMNGKWMHFVVDTRTGQPIADAQVEFFGYRQQRRAKPNDYRIETTRFARKTDTNGLVMVAPTEADNGEPFSWLVTARTDEGRNAYLGFDGLWKTETGRNTYDQAKAVVLTDRPVYRPGQPVRFKAWVARANYEQTPNNENEFAHKAFQVEVYDAKREKVQTRQLTANAYGGVEGEFTPEEVAPLGVYQIVVSGYGQGSFRVEEYKKPEFEVTVNAPEEGVRLGETFEAKISARYYFGSPVTKATVRYKVVRTPQPAGWFPEMPWDWLYGPGYWWPCGNDRWAPGWERWGVRLPAPRWSGWWRPTPPPEVVAQGEAPIDEDGTLKVSIDTTPAKERHGDSDHRYQITATVVDRSRRTIVGSGSVLAARKRVQTLAWLDRGYYSVDDPVTVRASTRQPDGEPLATNGVLRLLQVEYPRAAVGSGEKPQPKETEVRRWDLATDATGTAELQFKATDPGRYRIEYTARDGDGDEVQEAASGCLFTVHGEGFKSGDFEYDDLEIVLDKQEYRTGETAQVRINANRRGAVVLLFIRPAAAGSPWQASTYPAPQVLRIEGKSAVVPIEINRSDMPNFFVEAVAMHSGRLHTRVRQIVVPPEDRVSRVEVLPSAEAYLPGQKATVKLRVTDAAGMPMIGDTVVAIYDKSIDDIAGGSNAPDLRQRFWQWRRSHTPRTEHSLARRESNLTPKGQTPLGPIGIFGWRAVNEVVTNALSERRAERLTTRESGFASAAAAPQAAQSSNFFSASSSDSSPPGAQGGAAATTLIEPAIRSEFADTALWVGSIETDADGLAEVSLTMPENLTAWRVRAWSLSNGTRVGQGDAEVVTRKNLIVRLQTPRFLVDTDEVVLSANVHNYLEREKRVEVRLQLEGGRLEAESGNLIREAVVPPGEDVRVDWRVKAVREGEATVTASALTDEESDAMQLKLPVFVHGAERIESFTGVVSQDDRIGAFEINVPAKRRVKQTRLELRYAPTLVGTMVDALPYLIEYPHGCTEQTLNRFLPAAITQQTLKRLGVDLAEAKGSKTPTAPVDAQPPGVDASPKPATPPQAKPHRNPVYDRSELDRIVRAGVRRLQDMQLSDGGWGWFSGYGERSTPHTTAVVVRGLLIAKQNEAAIVDGVIDRGVRWLERHQSQELQKIKNAATKTERAKPNADNTDALVFSVLAEAGKRDEAMERFLLRDRLKLQPYTMAMLGLALHQHKNETGRDQVIRNLKQFVVRDEETLAAYLNLPGGYCWRWYGSEFEAHACFLKLLAATEPQSDLTAGIVKHLINNRRHATYWNSTRDTALVIEAMADYLAASGEAATPMEIEVWIDGEKRKTSTVSAADAVTFDGRFTLAGEALTPGRHTVELRKRSPSGNSGGRLYYSATLTNFTMEDDIRAAGLEVRVKRKLFKLTPVDASKTIADSRGLPTNQRTEAYIRTEISNLAKVISGDLLEVELTIDSKNDYEYLLIKDPKAAGFEPVESRSGYNGNELGAYVEYRDAAVNLFIQRLARGRHSLAYRLRAVSPGRFSALPTSIAAMYAPELRGNSDELKVRVEDLAD